MATNPEYGHDTYWLGKQIGKLAELTKIAHQLGLTKEKNIFLKLLKNILNNNLL